MKKKNGQLAETLKSTVVKAVVTSLVSVFALSGGSFARLYFQGPVGARQATHKMDSLHQQVHTSKLVLGQVETVMQRSGDRLVKFLEDKRSLKPGESFFRRFEANAWLTKSKNQKVEITRDLYELERVKGSVVTRRTQARLKRILTAELRLWKSVDKGFIARISGNIKEAEEARLELVSAVADVRYGLTSLMAPVEFDAQDMVDAQRRLDQETRDAQEAWKNQLAFAALGMALSGGALASFALFVLRRSSA